MSERWTIHVGPNGSCWTHNEGCSGGEIVVVPAAELEAQECAYAELHESYTRLAKRVEEVEAENALIRRIFTNDEANLMAERDAALKVVEAARSLSKESAPVCSEYGDCLYCNDTDGPEGNIHERSCAWRGLIDALAAFDKGRE